MKAKGKFISTLLVIDTFFVSYAAGFNSRHVLIVDPTMPAYVSKTETSASEADEKSAKKQDGKSGKTTDKNTNDGKPAHSAGVAGDAKNAGAGIGSASGGGSGASASAGTSARSGASESKDGKKGTKSGSRTVHKSTHSVQKDTSNKD